MHDFYGPVEQQIAGESVARKFVKRTAETAAAEDSENGSATPVTLRNRKAIFHITELNFLLVVAVELSDDEIQLASGGQDKNVRLWPINNEAEIFFCLNHLFRHT